MLAVTFCARCPWLSQQADLFGEVAEAKEAVEFAGSYKEARKCRAYETYQLLAGLITFGERAAELLTTVQVGAGQGSAIRGGVPCWACAALWQWSSKGLERNAALPHNPQCGGWMGA